MRTSHIPTPSASDVPFKRLKLLVLACGCWRSGLLANTRVDSLLTEQCSGLTGQPFSSCLRTRVLPAGEAWLAKLLKRFDDFDGLARDRDGRAFLFV